jgi:hypothetical protein
VSQILKQKYTFLQQLPPCAVFIPVWFCWRFVLKDNRQEIVYWGQKWNSRMFYSINIKRPISSPEKPLSSFRKIFFGMSASHFWISASPFPAWFIVVRVRITEISNVDSHSRKRYVGSKNTTFVALKQTRNRTPLEYHRIWHKTVLETVTGLRGQQYDHSWSVAGACESRVFNLTSCVSGQTS